MVDNKYREEQELMASQNIMQWLESDLSALISDENSGLSDLASFSRNLTKSKTENKLTSHNLHLIKEDLQNWWLVDFEWWIRNNKPFWFEVIWNDIEPTFTPNWDCLIPINFRYNSQRRTKILILHIEDNGGKNIYTVPDWDNEYEIEIWKENWVYHLIYNENWFHLTLK